MIKAWRDRQIPSHELVILLNQIEREGGTVFQLLPGERANHVLVVWSQPTSRGRGIDPSEISSARSRTKPSLQ